MDDETLQFYRRNAEAYADWAKAPSSRLRSFLALLPRGGSILELGCGAGNHSAEMLGAGFKVRATDGSPEMADIASRRLGHPVETMLFHKLHEHEAYDGVWASACLLHVPRDELAEQATYAAAGAWSSVSSGTSEINSFDGAPATMLHLVFRKVPD